MVDSLKHHSSSSIMSDLKSLFSILGMRRRTKVFVYGFMFAFVACTAYIAFNPTSGGGSPWFNDFFATATASTAPYRSQLSSFISRFFANSTSPFGDGMGFDGGPVVENGSALSRPPGGGGDRVSEVQQGGVLGNVGSQKGGLLGKNQTTAPDGSSQNGVPTKSQTGTGVGSPKNSVSMKNQTREGVESSQNGVLVKNQTVVGDGSHQNGVLMKNQTMVVGLPKQTGLPPQNKTSGAGGAVKNSAPASSPAKGASVPVRNETLGKNQTYVGVVNPASGNASAPAPAKKNAPPAASSGSGQMGIVGGNSVSNFSASLSKDKGSPPSAGPASSHGNQKREWSVESMKGCDIFQGRWMKDDTYPLYPQGSCPHIDEPFNCYLNGRPDQSYQKLRWQPDGCNIPRLNGTHMLEKLRGKRLVFVGDSLNRNMWESLVCVLRNSVKDKKKVFEASGRQQFRTEGSYSFLFEDYGCSVEFFRSPFLVQEWEIPDTNGKKKETLRLDTIERSSSKYKSADIIVFNTGHWWTHDKTSKGKDYYQEGNRVYSELNVVEAFHKALNTWAKWVDVNVNPQKTLVVFRGYSSSHFSGGQWNSGGQCDSETEPIKNDKYLSSYPPKMRVLESVLKGMKTPVSYLNITRMTDYRKDAHPSIYRKQHLTEEERRSPEQYQDCSHWCLPGVPDSWNEILYAQILIKQNQLQ